MEDRAAEKKSGRQTDGLLAPVVGRFAPTPSGEPHAGNLLCALLSYLSAKKKGGAYLVRIEDLDVARCPRAAGEKLLATLAYLGLQGDAPPLWQSERGNVYRAKEDVLRGVAEVYPCYCTRAALHAAEAPRLRDGGVVYAGTCRKRSESERAQLEKTRKPCYRIAVPDEHICFTDGVAGVYEQNLREACGDFILRRSDGVYAYQLAVAVDDGESGVTEVVRGNDLLTSTPRQIWLMRLLGYRPPTYYHIPLVCDPVGRKLSKSEGDGMARLCDRMSPQQILGKLAYAAGVWPQPCPATLRELTDAFAWDNVRKDKIVWQTESK